MYKVDLVLQYYHQKDFFFIWFEFFQVNFLYIINFKNLEELNLYHVLNL